MNPKKMFLGLAPWVVFTVIVNRHGADGAPLAALVAAGLSFLLLSKDAQRHQTKAIDITGLATFTTLAAVAWSGHSYAGWVADYGRGSAAAVLSLVMVISALTVPFTEQYAASRLPANTGRPRSSGPSTAGSAHCGAESSR